MSEILRPRRGAVIAEMGYPVRITGEMLDVPLAVGVILESTNAMASGKLVSIRVEGNEVAHINQDGAVYADLVGNVTGAVTGGVSGNVTGNLTGNVTGNVTGTLTGNVQSAALGAVSIQGKLAAASSGSDVSINSLSRRTAGHLLEIRNDNLMEQMAYIGPNGEVGVGGGWVMPVASSAYRGALWIKRDGAGITDTLMVCLKSAAGTYSWVTVVTGG